MPVNDRSIGWLRRVQRIPYWAFGFESSHTHNIKIQDDNNAASTGVAVYLDEDAANANERLMFVSPTNADGTHQSESAESIVGMGAGAPELTEISTFEFGGVLIGAAGDRVACLDMHTPPLMDPRYEIGVRVIWTPVGGSITATDDVTWLVKYDQVDFGEALAAATSTALNTVIAEQRVGATTQYVLKRTARGIINADVLDFTARAGAIAWSAEANAMDFSANEIAFLGLEIDFMPLLCTNPSEDVNAFSGLAAA